MNELFDLSLVEKPAALVALAEDDADALGLGGAAQTLLTAVRLPSGEDTDLEGRVLCGQGTALEPSILHKLKMLQRSTYERKMTLALLWRV